MFIHKKIIQATAVCLVKLHVHADGIRHTYASASVYSTKYTLLLKRYAQSASKTMLPMQFHTYIRICTLYTQLYYLDRSMANIIRVYILLISFIINSMRKIRGYQTATRPQHTKNTHKTQRPWRKRYISSKQPLINCPTYRYKCRVEVETDAFRVSVVACVHNLLQLKIARTRSRYIPYLQYIVSHLAKEMYGKLYAVISAAYGQPEKINTRIDIRIDLLRCAEDFETSYRLATHQQRTHFVDIVCIAYASL